MDDTLLKMSLGYSSSPLMLFIQANSIGSISMRIAISLLLYDWSGLIIILPRNDKGGKGVFCISFEFCMRLCDWCVLIREAQGEGNKSDVESFSLFSTIATLKLERLNRNRFYISKRK